MEHDEPRFACGRCALADEGDADADVDAEAPSSVSISGTSGLELCVQEPKSLAWSSGMFLDHQPTPSILKL
jgi:hypothetical protein